MGPALPTLDPRLSARERERVARRPVSRVLSNPCGPGRPFVWDAPYSAPHATNPGDGARTPLRHLLSQDRRPPLFGLAPGGVYPAAPVAGGAVRSCRTVSPLPAGPQVRLGSVRAVCFLWHFPWGRPRRPLTGTVFPWSPDFPPPLPLGSGRPAVWLSGDAPGPGAGQGSWANSTKVAARYRQASLTTEQRGHREEGRAWTSDRYCPS